jgi:hypothetical protein
LDFLNGFVELLPEGNFIELVLGRLLESFSGTIRLMANIRTTNPIESTFLRTKKTRTYVSRTTMLTIVYKLGLSAEKGWAKLRGFRRLVDVINGVKFIDGIDQETVKHQRIAA